ncbi:LysR substrate-binding domain-containing protein [Lichenicoccus roseus]|uniref:LysR family transcriptional regulator n=1 Tax=Lichenicoccus roseus TaxID=2683649 RepID=A0A5R9J1Q8_9PROT|nr:LysR substrate-binding domain-containing protein [Lichenicoccus roseus]TLU71585.1 LysR family transcriptional regulator [Lichenicoccus roseus]
MLKNVSLSAMRAFEAAARTGSFKAAATELGLSPSAISHAIFTLERSLGVPLFERDGRTILLSADGEQLMRHVGEAFEELRRGVDAVTNRGPQLLRLHSAPSFAAQWLSPRLPSFMRACPEIAVRLSASTDYASFASDDFDADIVYGLPRRGVTPLGLGQEVVTPICAPALAARLASPADLLSLPLIQSERKQVRWPDWCAENGIRPPSQQGGLRFDRSFLAIAAAVNGLGVALESTLLAERELADGSLVAPVLRSARNITYVGHHLVCPPNGVRRRPVRAFGAWMFAQLGVNAPDW